MRWEEGVPVVARDFYDYVCEEANAVRWACFVTGFVDWRSIGFGARIGANASIEHCHVRKVERGSNKDR